MHTYVCVVLKLVYLHHTLCNYFNTVFAPCGDLCFSHLNSHWRYIGDESQQTEVTLLQSDHLILDTFKGIPEVTHTNYVRLQDGAYV